jgi:methylmalonyl-CoA mutase
VAVEDYWKEEAATMAGRGSMRFDDQIRSLEVFQKVNAERRDAALDDLKKAALAGENVFDSLMEAVKSCSLGQLSGALYEVGGQYRRNM